MSFPAGPQVTPTGSFLLLLLLCSSVLPLFHKYVGTGICFSDCFFFAGKGKMLLSFLWTDSKVSFRQCVLLALLSGGNLSVFLVPFD